MSVATQAIMAGMPESAELHRIVHDGQTIVMAGRTVLAAYASDDVAMRNMVLVMLTELGFRGVDVAWVFGLTPEHLSTVRGKVRRHGSAVLVQRQGRPPKLSARQLEQARALKAEGATDAEIARRLGVSHKTAAKATASAPAGVAQPALELPDAGAVAAAAGPADDPVVSAPRGVSDEDDRVARVAARIAAGRFASRYAGAALLHAFTDRVGAADLFALAIGAAAPGGLAVRAPR